MFLGLNFVYCIRSLMLFIFCIRIREYCGCHLCLKCFVLCQHFTWFDFVTDPSSCSVSVSAPATFGSSKKCVSCCTLYHDKGIEPWLRMTSTDAWLSTGVGETIDGTDGSHQDQGDIYCVACYDNGDLEIFDVPNFISVFYVDKFVSGKSHLVDFQISDLQKNSEKVDRNSQELISHGRNESSQSMKVVEVAMQRWSGQYSRPFLFGILTDGTILCYHAYLFESTDSASKIDDSVSKENSVSSSNMSSSRLRNLRFLRVPLDIQGRDDMPNGTLSRRLSIFKNISGYQGLFLCGSRPAWLMVFRERLRVHPQVLV